MTFINMGTFLFSTALYLFAVILGAIIRLYIMGKFKIRTIIIMTSVSFILGEIVLAYLILFKQT